MTRLWLLLGLVLALGATAVAQQRGIIVISSPASEEVTVMKFIPVSYLSIERLTEALGGEVFYLYGERRQPLGVIKDAREALDTFFSGGSRGARDAQQPATNGDFTTQTGPVNPRREAMGR